MANKIKRVMKELSIEEKAKRYDCAYKVAEDIHKYSSDPAEIKRMEEIFPELKESEDEMMRAIAIKAVHAPEAQSCIKSWGINPDDVIAWLEKQVSACLSHDDEIMIKQLIEYFTTGEGLQNTNDTVVEWLADVKRKLEKQGKQKLADKVEPKFKVGDWLVENEPNNYARFVQILEVINVQGKDRYRISRDLHNDEDIVDYGFIEYNYHSFNIKDAEDGDVLADDNLPFIFKKIDTNRYSYAYCGISVYDGFKIETNGIYGEWTWSQDIKPATKEQRNLLFQKMHKAGYEWDGDKKELLFSNHSKKDTLGSRV